MHEPIGIHYRDHFGHSRYNFDYWYYVALYVAILSIFLMIVFGSEIKYKPILLTNIILLVSETYIFGFCVSDNYYQTKSIFSVGFLGLIKIFMLNESYDDNFAIKRNMLK